MRRPTLLILTFALALVLPPAGAVASNRDPGRTGGVFGGHVDPWASWGTSHGVSGSSGRATSRHIVPPGGHIVPPGGHIVPPRGHIVPPSAHVISPRGHVDEGRWVRGGHRAHRARPVWVPAFWQWTGAAWVLVPGHWAWATW